MKFTPVKSAPQEKKEASEEAQVLKGQTGKLRCRRCGNLATVQPDGKGGTVTKCNTCGATYTAKPLD